MRAQAAVEFLTTYGFLLLMLAAVLVLLAFYTFFPQAAIPQQCTAYGGPSCSFINLFSNTTGRYSLVTLVLANAQAIPINISSVTVSIRSLNFKGACTPNFVLPGQEATCVAYLNESLPLGTVVQGFYSLPATFCNSGIGSLNGTCAYENATYTGAFSTSPETDSVVVFSVAAAQSSPTVNSIALPAAPYLPAGFSTAQNGDWVVGQHNGIVGYAFATSTYQGTQFNGFDAAQFPSIVSSLNNGNVACSGSRNSTMSLAYTTFYLPGGASLPTSISTAGYMEVYYKSSTATVWAPLYNGAAWRQSTPAQFTNTIIANPGYENVAVVWVNTCRQDVQALNMSGVPRS